MKKTRILVLALTLALLVCAAFAITASAEDDDNVAILSKNVVYSSNVQMMFAVDVTLEEAKDVVVKYYFESDPEAICTATLNSVTNPDMIYTDANGVKHPSFSTIGIPSKEYGNKVYVSAQMKGSSAEEEYVEYSVAEYFYEKLYAQAHCCSLMEAALLSISPSQTAELKRISPRAGKCAIGLKQDIDKPLAVILIINTAAHTIVCGREIQLWNDLDA